MTWNHINYSALNSSLTFMCSSRQGVVFCSSRGKTRTSWEVCPHQLSSKHQPEEVPGQHFQTWRHKEAFLLSVLRKYQCSRASCSFLLFAFGVHALNQSFILFQQDTCDNLHRIPRVIKETKQCMKRYLKRKIQITWLQQFTSSWC